MKTPQLNLDSIQQAFFSQPSHPVGAEFSGGGLANGAGWLGIAWCIAFHLPCTCASIAL